jgi:hypothetical protein
MVSELLCCYSSYWLMVLMVCGVLLLINVVIMLCVVWCVLCVV